MSLDFAGELGAPAAGLSPVGMLHRLPERPTPGARDGDVHHETLGTGVVELYRLNLESGMLHRLAAGPPPSSGASMYAPGAVGSGAYGPDITFTGMPPRLTRTSHGDSCRRCYSRRSRRRR